MISAESEDYLQLIPDAVSSWSLPGETCMFLLSAFSLCPSPNLTVLGCSHRSDAHAHLILCSHRLFALCTSSARGEGLAMSPSSSLLPPTSFQVRLLARISLSTTVLAWRGLMQLCSSGALGFLDSVRILHGHALAFLGRVNGISSCGRDPLFTAVCDSLVALQIPVLTGA